jgi:Ni,Fe-hydrogenase III small subunit
MQLFLKIWRTGIATEALRAADPAAVEIGRRLERRIADLFGRALAIREVDAGSCNGCEIEILGMTSPVYDMERFGLHFVASPRHADMLLVTGPVTRNMEVPLRRTYEATPDPKLVVAVGDCAKTCGVFKNSYAVVGPVDSVIPVDVTVTGCPPEPADILRGILEALDRGNRGNCRNRGDRGDRRDCREHFARRNST